MLICVLEKLLCYVDTDLCIVMKQLNKHLLFLRVLSSGMWNHVVWYKFTDI
jgi:hypothetical protein